MSDLFGFIATDDRPQDFEGRIQVATKFEDEVLQKIKEMGFKIAKNGTEHTHPEFTECIRSSEDPTSLAIRFSPDAVAAIGKIPRSFFVEMKAGRAIERRAYQEYMKKHQHGQVVVVVFKMKGEWMWNTIESIGLEDGNKSVSCFPLEKRQPVDEHGWIVPSKQFKKANGNASGTPYKYVLSASLIPFSEFKERVIKMLGKL